MPNILAPSSRESNFKVAQGQHTTVAASDTVATGLKHVLGVVVSLDSDPVDDPFMVTAVAPTTTPSGDVTIKTWKNTGGTDPTPIAATTFSKKVNWIAFGY